MNEELINRIMKEREREDAAIEASCNNGFEIMSLYVAGEVVTVFIEVCEYEAMIELLRGKKYKLEKYYNNSNNLSVTYSIEGLDNIDFDFFIPLTQVNLDKVSGGKCKIETVSIPQTEKLEVVCNMEG